MLRNTTDIPDRLVAIAAAFALASLEPKPLVQLIKIKNKRRGKLLGQWGWYFHHSREVHVIVPRKISRNYTFKKKYSRKVQTLGSRAEFLVSVLAHELRHAWQFDNWNTPSMKWRLEMNRVAKYAREVDAEIFEIMVAQKWQREISPQLRGVA